MVLCNTAPNWFWQFVSLFALFDTGMFWCSRNRFHHGFQSFFDFIFTFYTNCFIYLFYIFYLLLWISEKIPFWVPFLIPFTICKNSPKKCSFIPFQANLTAILRDIVESSSSNMKHIKSHSPQKNYVNCISSLCYFHHRLVFGLTVYTFRKSVQCLDVEMFSCESIETIFK